MKTPSVLPQGLPPVAATLLRADHPMMTVCILYTISAPSLPELITEYTARIVFRPHRLPHLTQSIKNPPDARETHPTHPHTPSFDLFNVTSSRFPRIRPVDPADSH